MLAIITKMTLTQVSTWFANARRRLKKENKMTWTPRNRSEDEEDEDNIDLERNDEDEEPLKTHNDELETSSDAGEFGIGAAAGSGLKENYFIYIRDKESQRPFRITTALILTYFTAV